MNIIIKNGTIVNADANQKADILISAGKIASVGKMSDWKTDDAEIFDAEGKYIFPGGIDPHVHMELPTPAGVSSDDFYTGSRAALYGGTTALIDFVTPHRGQSLVDALISRKKEAEKSLVDVRFHVSPVEWRPETAGEIRACIHEFGVKSFKCYMAYKKNIGLDDDALFSVMKVVGEEGGLVTLHCEDGDAIEILREKYAATNIPGPEAHVLSRPPELEAKAVEKAIQLAARAKCPIYIVHVSSAKSIEIIKQAQAKGQKVVAETCPQYLLLDGEKYNQPFEKAVAFVMSPPLRTKSDNQKLWESLEDGTIYTIGTDHCNFTLEQKLLGKDDFRKIPNGAGGVEHRLELLYTFGVLKNRISLNRFVELTSTNPVKIFGLYPYKGVIAPGSDADLVIWNPKHKSIISAKNHHQNSDLNIYEGTEIQGKAEYVFLNGKPAISPVAHNL
jgi:dihydropyrimidinase